MRFARLYVLGFKTIDCMVSLGTVGFIKYQAI